MLPQTVEKPQFCIYAILCGVRRKTGWKQKQRYLCESFYFHLASRFKLMAANLSLTQFRTWARPLTLVYHMACFSLASAKTRSMVSFHRLYIRAKNGVYRASSANSIKCHAVMDVSGCYFHTQYKALYITSGMSFIGKLPLVVSLDE